MLLLHNICMEASQHKAEVGANLRVAIQVTHGGNASAFGREFGLTPHKVGNWLRGDNYPDMMVLIRYCDEYGLTLDWFFRGKASGVASDVAVVLKQRKLALPVA